MEQVQRGTVIQGLAGVNYDIVDLPEAATQSFKRGEYVETTSTGGKLTVCADNAVDISGLALQDASGVTDATVQVAVPRSGCKFQSSVFHSTPGSAITAITQPGTKYALKVESNQHYIDIEDTDNDAFLATRIILPAGHSVGDQYGILEFELLIGVGKLSSQTNA